MLLIFSAVISFVIIFDISSAGVADNGGLGLVVPSYTPILRYCRDEKKCKREKGGEKNLLFSVKEIHSSSCV